MKQLFTVNNFIHREHIHLMCISIISFSPMPNIKNKVQFQKGILLILSIWMKKLFFFSIMLKKCIINWVEGKILQCSNFQQYSCSSASYFVVLKYLYMRAIGTKSSGVKFNIVLLKIYLYCLWGWANLCTYSRKLFKFYWEAPVPHCNPNYLSIWKQGQRRIFPFRLCKDPLKFSCGPL